MSLKMNTFVYVWMNITYENYVRQMNVFIIYMYNKNFNLEVFGSVTVYISGWEVWEFNKTNYCK